MKNNIIPNITKYKNIEKRLKYLTDYNNNRMITSRLFKQLPYNDNITCYEKYKDKIIITRNFKYSIIKNFNKLPNFY